MTDDELAAAITAAHIAGGIAAERKRPHLRVRWALFKAGVPLHIGRLTIKLRSKLTPEQERKGRAYDLQVKAFALDRKRSTKT